MNAPRFPRSLITCLLLTLLVSLPSVAADPRVIGTIEATLDDQPMAWHLLHGNRDATHSALWMMQERGRNMAVLGGYESTAVRFDTDGNGFATVAGPGTSLIISFGFGDNAEAITHTVADEDTEQVSVIYLTRVGDYSSMYTMTEGNVTVDDIRVGANGLARFSGTFRGRLQSRDESQPGLAITQGRFEVEQARRVESPADLHPD